MLAYPKSTILLRTRYTSYATYQKSKQTSELKIYIKLPGDLGMSKKVKKQIVSTHDQRLAHHIFLEICILKSFVYITP